MSIEMNVIYMNGVPHHILEVNKKHNRTFRVPTYDTEYTIKMEKRNFVPVNVTKDMLIGKDVKEFTHAAYQFLNKVCIEDLYTMIYEEDIDFIWCEEIKLLAIRIRLSLKENIMVPIIMNHSWIDNGTTRALV